VIIDWKASKVAWIDDVQTRLIPQLRSDLLFSNADLLIRRFNDVTGRWQPTDDFRSIINDGNELCAAAALLGDLRPGDRLHYEPRLQATAKSIDFRVEWHDGGRSWVDMKTVAPGWQNDEAAWQRFCKIASDFPRNATLLVDRNFCGAALGGQALKARWSFVQRTLELEAKIAFLTEAERGPVRLLLCNDGTWHEDDLEDFADFYFSGQFRPDDWAQNAVARYMADRHQTFARSIAGFCYLERRQDEVFARRFEVDVRGPRLFGRAA
jgi:hypothetical protein